MKFTQCPGCGHHYGRPMSSYPNDHGYCHWCREEGVCDAESQAQYNAKWAAYHKAKERAEEEEHRRRVEENS